MSWKKVKLGSFLRHRDTRFKPDDAAIIGLKRVDKIDFSGKLFLSEKSSKTDMILVKQGDLLISGINVEKGAMCVYQGEEDIIATIHYSSYEFDPAKIDAEFLKYYLKSAEFKQALKEQVPGGIKTEIKPKHLLPLIVEIPTEIREQQEIVLRLKEQEEKNTHLLNEFSHQLSLLKKLRQSLLQDAVQGRLVAQDAREEPASVLLEKIKAEKEKLIQEKKVKKEKIQEAEIQEEILFNIPLSWEWCMLGELCETITDGTHQTPKYTDSGRIFLSAQNVKPFRFLPEIYKYVSEEAYTEYIKNKKPALNDILVARVGAGIGEAAVIDQVIDFCFYVSLALIKPLHEHVYSRYLELVINSPYGVKYAKGNISSKGGSAGNFNLGRIRAFLIPLPPLSEQHRIVEKLESLLVHCDALEQQVLESQKAAGALLQVALKEALERPVEVII